MNEAEDGDHLVVKVRLKHLISDGRSLMRVEQGVRASSSRG
jgi:hypothetical protein